MGAGIMRVTVLGCGGSSGVPVIGNNWGACDARNPRNHRSRPSVLVEDRGCAILIDTTPDLRQQLLRERVRRLDAVIYSHAHADHAHGIDELREICRLMNQPVPVYADAESLADLRSRFGYCFEPLQPGWPIYRPVLVPHQVEGPFRVGAVEVVPFVQDHGYSTTLGYRFGDFAYSTDVVRLDEAAFAVLEGIKVWVVDCVREGPEHPVHAHLAVTLGWIERVRPQRAFLTHMSQAMDYDQLSRRLPPGVAPAHDGLVIDLDEGSR
ncbi:phosphoribosyl 1,2-cyclic phosphate phosphodiesterase [uncultured Gammaproteobacteria bacterium]